MDEAELPDNNYKWEKLSQSITWDEKHLLNCLQDVLTENGHFSRSENEHMKAKNHGARVIRVFLENLLESMQNKDGLTLSSENAVLSEQELSKRPVIDIMVADFENYILSQPNPLFYQNMGANLSKKNSIGLSSLENLPIKSKNKKKLSEFSFTPSTNVEKSLNPKKIG